MPKGIERVKANVKRRVDEITGPTTEKAVYALLSQGAAMAAVHTPIDTGTLINSQYAPQISASRGATTGHVGYTAAYAGAVHDAPGTLTGLPRPDNRGVYWGPDGKPKFLELGMKDVAKNGLEILRRHYNVR